MKTNPLPQLPHQLTQLTAQLQNLLPLSLPPSLPLSRLGQAISLDTRSYRGWARRLNRSKGWLLGGLGGLLLLWFFWQWLLALTVGLAVMLGVYLGQQGQLKSWRGWQRLWGRANRALSLSALAGLMATGTAYLSLAIWLESDRSWLASGVILEGLALLAILSLLLWRQFGFAAKSEQHSTDLTQLASSDPLQRLIAIRQLTQTAQQPYSPLAPSHLSECFRLMLDRETEPLLCNALIESLQQLDPTKHPTNPIQPGSSPLPLRRQTAQLDQLN